MIGILALQGAFVEHADVLSRLGRETLLVKSAADFDRIDSLVLPGGESTVMLKLLRANRLMECLHAFIHVDRKPVMGVCAGLILLAHPEIRGLDIQVERNYYGSQLASFIDTNTFLSERQVTGVYIRAPKIVSLDSDEVVSLSTNSRGEITGVRQNNIIGFTFHPELTSDTTIHEYFLRSFKKN